MDLSRARRSDDAAAEPVGHQCSRIGHRQAVAERRSRGDDDTASVRLKVVGQGSKAPQYVNVPLEGSPGLWRRVARAFGTQAGIADWTLIRFRYEDEELTEGVRFLHALLQFFS